MAQLRRRNRPKRRLGQRWRDEKHVASCRVCSLVNKIKKKPSGPEARKLARIATRQPTSSPDRPRDGIRPSHAREMLFRWIGAANTLELIRQEAIPIRYVPVKAFNKLSTRERRILWVCHNMIKNRVGLTTKGVPNLRVLSKHSNLKVSARERDRSLELLHA